MLWILGAALAASAATPKVTTVAGGYAGNGKPATSASLAYVDAVATDKKGNVYIADNCRIRKVNKLSVISTFAGTGKCGFGGDGGPAKSAMLTGAEGLAFDAQGSLLFSDIGNSRIRKIDASGIITTVAGNGTKGYSGDGGPAVDASLSYPEGIAIDPSGRLLISDSSNLVIRMVDNAGIIHTVAGNHTYGFSGDGGPATSAQLGGPSSVAADTAGNFYIADSSNDRVRRVDTAGIITTYAGNGSQINSGNGGPANQAGLGYTNGVFISGGNLYISTGGNIWAVDMGSLIATIIAGDPIGRTGFSGDGQPALSSNLAYPRGMANDRGGNLLFADSSNLRVRRIDAGHIINTFAGGYVGDGGSPKAAGLGMGYFGGRMAFDAAGNLYIADSLYNRVRKVSPAGVITTFAGTGISGYSGDGGPAAAATLYTPDSVVVDAAGNVFIADTGNGVIRKVDPKGNITTFISTVTIPAPWGGDITLAPSPYGMAMDASGNIYSASLGLSVVLKIAPDGTASILAGVLFSYGYNGDGIPATQAHLSLPSGVTFDGAGNTYIADWNNNRIRKVDVNGIISTVAGDGIVGFGGDGGPATSAHLSLPLDVALDATGKLYIADDQNFRIRVVDTTGTITTLAGTSQFGYNGNGLPPTSTNMFPVSIVIGPKGWVYYADQGCQRVRAIH